LLRAYNQHRLARCCEGREALCRLGLRRTAAK
jgi:hypothetical protein